MLSEKEFTIFSRLRKCCKTVAANDAVPGDAEDYVHRIGRTARAKATGVAVTLVNENDMPKMHRIERLIENEVFKTPLPDFLGAGPEWRLRPSTPRDHIRQKGGFKQKRKPSGERHQTENTTQDNNKSQPAQEGKSFHRAKAKPVIRAENHDTKNQAANL